MEVPFTFDAELREGRLDLAEITGGGGAQVLGFDMLPESFTTMKLTTADEPYAPVGPMKPEGSPEGVLVQEPRHGDLVPVVASWDPSVVDRFIYVADAGFTGKDTPAPDGEHTVPETVETGSATAWWLAAAGALGAGALLRLRPARQIGRAHV